MTRYSVYLEIADDGRRMAHMPSLSGCTVRAPAGTRPRAGLQSFSTRRLLRHLDNAEDLRAAS